MKDVLSRCLLAYATVSFPHIQIYPSAKLLAFDTLAPFEFPVPMQHFFLFLLSHRFLTQDNQERNGTAPTERPLDPREILCAREDFKKKMSPPKWLWSASLSLKVARLLVSDCRCFLLQGAAGQWNCD